MNKKMYTKEDMNFEGISMQEGKTSSTLKLLLFMIITAAVLGLLIFTAGSFFSGKNENEEIPQITILPTSAKDIESTLTAEPTPVEDGVTPSVTPRVTIKLSPTTATNKISLSLEVLNGSGVKGAAGKLTTTLINAGYHVLKTGNADAFTYTGVTVKIKKSKETFLKQLKKDLSAGNYLVTDSSSTQDEASTADAVIILGAEQ